MLLTQEQVLQKIQADLNALVIELGFIDDKGLPIYYFHGELSTYDNYDWIKSIETFDEKNTLRYLQVIPFALIRDNSTPSHGEMITERLDEYSFYCYIKPEQVEDIRELFEIYMSRENMTNNLVDIDNSSVLKQFSNFVIDDEVMTGAPDGNSRHQVTMTFTYDIFESSLTSSKDYDLFIDGIKVKYLSWRFDKANMISANHPNQLAGYNNLGTNNKLHEITLVFELYIDKTNPAIEKINNDLFSLVKYNTEYQIELKKNNISILSIPMILNGGKTTDTPPQINTMEVTFARSYPHASVKIGLVGNIDGEGNQIFERLFLANYKFGHAAALYTSTYFGDNASKSKIIGLAKGFMITTPLFVDSSSLVLHTLLGEVLGKVYTNTYILSITYFGIERIYNVVLNDSSIESDDALYDMMSFVFVEAK